MSTNRSMSSSTIGNTLSVSSGNSAALPPESAQKGTTQETTKQRNRTLLACADEMFDCMRRAGWLLVDLHEPS